MKPIHVLFWLASWRCTDALENAITCDPKIPNANILSGNKKYTLGERLDYECNQFHIPKERQETFCRESGWEKRLDCKLVKCRPVQATGDLIARGNTERPQYGDIIQFECRTDDKKINGEKQINCTDTGEWSASIPRCEVVKCRAVQATGDLIARGNTERPQYGDIIQFECRTDSMKMNGEKQIHCTDTGEWSASIPRCEVVKCRPVQATGDLYAFGNTKSPQHGDIIQFECRKDYMKIKGEKQIHCTDAGEWSAIIPQCEDINADRKAEIRINKMSEDMQRYAIDCATQAMEKFSVRSDIAGYIKQEFDKKYNPKWHCIVGRDFGALVTYNTDPYIFFGLRKYFILLFKSG